MFSVTKTGTWRLPSWTAMGCPITCGEVPPRGAPGRGVPRHLREDPARARPGLQHLALVALVHLVDPAEEAGIDEGSLLDGTAHRALLPSSIATTDDHLSGRLVLAGAQAHGRLAPWRLGRHPGRGLALPTAVGT